MEKLNDAAGQFFVSTATNLGQNSVKINEDLDQLNSVAGQVISRTASIVLQSVESATNSQTPVEPVPEQEPLPQEILIVPRKYSLKVIVLGASEVGKTQIISRYTDNTFSENYAVTLAPDFSTKHLELGPYGEANLQIFDTPGQVTSRSLGLPLYRVNDVSLFVFDASQPDSFAQIEKIYEFYTNHKESKEGHNWVGAVVANKSDLVTNTDYREKAKMFSIKHKLDYFECSAKTGDGVEDIFKHVCKLLVAARASTLDDNDDDGNITNNKL
eukprot:TRINITY_DN5459_c0_g1_i1.p1 TRINITY_DN5459_c0_g1~~TRINITY_DN5459_c0_g1_i1.p1  ORF type:complete len:271 (+),score=34.53 TRINITY_DN5459_c0_g1_i1:259-1071(+)